MKEIKLTQGNIALVDDKDFERINKYKWRSYLNANTWYAVTGQSRDGNLIHMHQMIMGFPESRIDHKDNDGLNNQKFNLREATHSQNIANGKKRTTNKSGYYGVSWHKASQSWVAQICINYTKIHLGCFKDSKDAALAFNEASTKYFGEFGKQNKL